MEKRTGQCHCGAVQYEAELDLSQPVIECNCSICEGKGLLLTFIPKSQLTISQGEDSLTEYRFNTEKIAHLFCKVCGSEVFGKVDDFKGTPTYAINARTITDIDLSALTRMPYDGKSR